MIIINRAAALAYILLKALYVTNRRSDQCVTYLLLLLHVAYTHKSGKKTVNQQKNIVYEEEKKTKRGKNKNCVIAILVQTKCKKVTKKSKHSFADTTRISIESKPTPAKKKLVNW